VIPEPRLLGLVLTGGGARSAYQVGVLKGIADLLRRGSACPFPIITGTSAGAVGFDKLAGNGVIYHGMALLGGGAVLAGLILGAASINVPVILDSYATGAAALIAARLAPAVTGYLIAAHRGSFTMPAILRYLGLESIFEVGLGHGEGSGAAMVLPLIDQVAAIASRG